MQHDCCFSSQLHEVTCQREGTLPAAQLASQPDLPLPSPSPARAAKATTAGTFVGGWLQRSTWMFKELRRSRFVPPSAPALSVSVWASVDVLRTGLANLGSFVLPASSGHTGELQRSRFVSPAASGHTRELPRSFQGVTSYSRVPPQPEDKANRASGSTNKGRTRSPAQVSFGLALPEPGLCAPISFEARTNRGKLTQWFYLWARANMLILRQICTGLV